VNAVIAFFAMMFTSGWLGVIFGVVLLVIVAGAIVGVCYFAFWAADAWFVFERQATGTITGSGSDDGFFMVTPIMMYMPESYSINIKVGDDVAGFEVSEKYYREAQKGQTVTVRYTRGRFSGKLRIKRIVS